MDLRFSKLEKLKQNSWKEEVDVACEKLKRPVARRLKEKTVKKASKSSLHAMIAGTVFSAFDIHSCHFSLFHRHLIDLLIMMG